MILRPLSAARETEPRTRAVLLHALAFVGYAALTLLYLRPAARVLATHLAPDPEDPLFVLVVLKWGIRQWHLGLPDFWNMPFFFPARGVATYSDHLLGPAALAALFTAVVPNVLLAYNLLFLGSFALSGWSTWYVLRRTGLGIPAAFLGGCLFAFAPFRWDQMSHLAILLMQWIPLTLWTWDRLLTQPTWRRALAFLPFYVLHVTGGSYLAYMIHLPLAIQLLCRVPALRRNGWLRSFRVLVPVGVLCAWVLAAVFLPYLHGSHQKRSRTEIQIFSASLVSYLTPSDRNSYDVLWPAGLRRAENILFPGILVSVLAIAAVRRIRQRERPTTPSRFAALPRRRQLVLVGLGLLSTVAWIGGELRTWVFSGKLEPSAVDRRALAALAFGVGMTVLVIAWRTRRDLALLGVGALLGGAALWGALRWRHVPLAAFSTYRLGVVVICSSLLIWLLWRRWTPGVPRFLATLDPWHRGLLISGVVCFLLSFPMIYLPMLKILPGLSGMRVPARFFPFVLFPLVVLAAGELDRRWRAARPERRRAFALVAAALVLLEVAPRRVSWGPLPSDEALAPVYHWLAHQPAVDAILELPLGERASDISYMYAMTLHWVPLVNGYSGYLADHYAQLAQSCCFPVPTAEQLQTLRSWGVTHVVLHETRLAKRWERRSADAWAEPGVSIEYEDGTDRVYRIAPSKAARGR